MGDKNLLQNSNIDLQSRSSDYPFQYYLAPDELREQPRNMTCMQFIRTLGAWMS
ncbi:putative iSEc21 transposase [Escherichia coli 1-176-05_S1_C3]|nr:putative iSEc21 transposase [Escherichia coli 1-176-05_S1_C1]EZK08601.1 putative iSEc21 transposase [Escherichia coli 1-176-05_S1_C3]EZK09125.1 putative iSEc21 transposase [Escherichia coli 1-176-05_S1_C2]